MKRDLAALAAREYDLLVIGGGIHGAFVAWDAAQRGLSTALVEAADFGSGASWNSLKTIHGGLRHLQRADLSGLRESARERRTLLRIAPGLVRPLGFLVPAQGHGPKGREALAIGLALNDALTWDRNRGVPLSHHIPRGRMLSAREAAPLLPAGAPATPAALWTDAQVASTERLLLAVLHAAVGAGARVANYARVSALRVSQEAVCGAAVRDVTRDAPFDLRARQVVLAAGSGLSALWHTAGLHRKPVPLLGAVNLVLRRKLLSTVAVGASVGGRFLFLVPWGESTLLGTDYAPLTPAGGPDPAAFLGEAARAFPWAALTLADVALVHRGQVPGERDGHGLFTRSYVIDHAREDGVRGLHSLVAVKYTTARAVAEVAVDGVQRALGLRVTQARTSGTALPGAHLLGGPIEARALVAVQDEMALHLEDALLRRLDMGTAGVPDSAAAEEVLEVMARRLGFSPERVAQERAVALQRTGSARVWADQPPPEGGGG